MRKRRHGSEHVVLYDGWGKVGCSVEGCDRPHNAKGMCKTHYKRVLVGKNGLSPNQPIRKGWAGGQAKPPVGKRMVDWQGYTRVYRPGHPHATYGTGWGLEHRVVMSDHLGRPLLGDELVHHINGDRSDNRLENLELCVRRQPPGQRVADLLPWARELVERYDGHLFA